jgi:hypothetical protein
MQHYPVIDSIVDSFGNVSIAGDISNEALVRLGVGDSVSFNCTGMDPQARALLWRLEVMQGVATSETADQESGNTVTLTWVVKDVQVGETAYAMILLASDGQYHRIGNFDDRRVLNYAVDPPMERP